MTTFCDDTSINERWLLERIESLADDLLDQYAAPLWSGSPFKALYAETFLSQQLDAMTRRMLPPFVPAMYYEAPLSEPTAMRDASK